MSQTLLREHLEQIVQDETALTKRFYEILFTRYPAARPLFGRRSEEAQARMLQDAIVAVVEHLDSDRWLTTHLRALGRTHNDYGVTPVMYAWVGECLIAALKDLSGERWTAELESAWAGVYGRISNIMIEAQADAGAVAVG
jgi:hemoglobin-like flavoprotein